MAIFYCAAVLLIGGFLKGVIGLGLPQIGVPLIALALGLRQGLAVLVLPVIVSNVAQGLSKQHFLAVLRRFWPLLIVMFCCAALSTRNLGAIPERQLLTITGVLLLVFPTIAYFKPALRVSRRQEIWLGPLTGVVAGLIGGVSGLPGPPLMIYLACLRLPKEEFVVAVSLMFLVAAIGLALGLATFADTSPSELALSAAACVPVFLGMWLGTKVRMQIGQRAFARLVFGTYVATGTSFLLKAAW